MNESHRATCLELASRLSEYLDGELPPTLQESVRKHFDACADCEKFLQSLQSVKHLGQWLPRPELEPDRLHAIADRLRNQLDDEDA